MRVVRTTLLAALLLTSAIPAAAEDGDLPRVSVNAGAGVALPFQGEIRIQ